MISENLCNKVGTINTTLLVSLCLLMMAGNSLGQDATDLTGKAPSSDELINALQTEKPKTRSLRTRTIKGRGISVNEAQPIVTPKSVNLTIEFELNSVQLTDQARDVLEQLGLAMNSDQLGSDKFKIVGHTDSSGATDYNYNLSLDRSAAVERYLIRNHGINEARLVAEGKGELQPLETDNPTSEKNRRVEIINLGRQ